MTKQMTIWGVGPAFAFFSFMYFLFTLILHILYYPLFIIEIIPYSFLVGCGLALLSIGIPIWVVSAMAIVKGFSQEELVTQGVYSICRHPLYGQGIFYTVPGCVMFFKSYIILSLPFFMYVLFRKLITAEEKHLQKKFGDDFISYSNAVNMVFPKFWKIFV